MSKGSKDADPGYKGKGHEHGADQQVETDSRAKGKTKAGGKDCGKGDANQQAESDSRAKGKTKAGGKDYGKGDATSTMGSADQQVETDSSAKGKTNAGGKDYGKGDANQQAESDSRAKGKTKAGGKDYGKYYKGKKGKSKDDDGKTGMKGKRKADQGAEAIWFHHKLFLLMMTTMMIYRFPFPIGLQEKFCRKLCQFPNSQSFCQKLCPSLTDLDHSKKDRSRLRLEKSTMETHR